MKIVGPFDFSIIFIVPTLIIWPVYPPHFIKVELIIGNPIGGITGANVNSWNKHNVTLKGFNIGKKCLLWHFIGINSEDVITGTFTSMIVSMIGKLSIKLSFVNYNLIIV